MDVGDPGRGRKASKDIPMDRKMNKGVRRYWNLSSSLRVNFWWKVVFEVTYTFTTLIYSRTWMNPCQYLWISVPCTERCDVWIWRSAWTSCWVGVGKGYGRTFIREKPTRNFYFSPSQRRRSRSSTVSTQDRFWWRTFWLPPPEAFLWRTTHHTPHKAPLLTAPY